MENLCKPYKSCRPIDITQGFGAKNNYPPYKHTGVDFGSWYGTALVAPVNCKIINIIKDIPFQSLEAEEEEIRKGYGVIMKSAQEPDTYYLYWHCTGYFPVEIGQFVQQGEMVAQMGNSGYVIQGGVYVPIGNRFLPPYLGTHLHFEGFTEKNGNRKYFDILPLIDWGIAVKNDNNIFQKMSIILQKMVQTLKTK